MASADDRALRKSKHALSGAVSAPWGTGLVEPALSVRLFFLGQAEGAEGKRSYYSLPGGQTHGSVLESMSGQRGDVDSLLVLTVGVLGNQMKSKS